MNNFKIYFIVSFALLLFSCGEDEPEAIFDDTTYIINYKAFAEPNLPEDNPLTVEGVKLGRMLFYETLLSSDDSQSCASCHKQENAFTDENQFSEGVLGNLGDRNSMNVFNMVWNTNGFFWDGRAELLRHQALMPIENEVELNETLGNVISKLSAEEKYKNQFIRAFGNETITEEKMAFALEQFMFSIISNSSKYDKYLAGELELTESEERGRELYFTEYNPFFPEVSGADCAHCHGGFNFENDNYMNNGLDTDAEITDIGREKVTENANDKARFKVPSLRNIELTGPYMHDGRFETLEEVINHYNDGIKISATLDQALLATTDTGLLLTDEDKTDLINFLKTLTDNELLENAAYSSPF